MAVPPHAQATGAIGTDSPRLGSAILISQTVCPEAPSSEDVSIVSPREELSIEIAQSSIRAQPRGSRDA
jgi:hypothetical protein